MGMKNRLCIELHYVMTEASTSSDNVVKPKGANSAVWTYFGVEKTKEKRSEVAVFCRMCKKKVSAKGSNTSNLVTHIRSITRYNAHS